MTLLAIIGRELRTAARRPGTFRARLLTVLVTMGMFAFVFWTAVDGSLPVEQQGRLVFRSLAQVASVCSLLLGLMLTPDSVSSEKRENTLGLLFLTDLKGFHVILGKLVANSWNGLYCLLGTLPVLAIPLLMGGITGWDLFQVGVVLLVFLLLSVSTGIFVSTFSILEWRAIFYTALFLIALSGLPAFIGYCVAIRGNAPWAELWPLFVISPAYVWQIWAGRFQGPGNATAWPEEYVWVMAGTQLALALLLIVIASRYIARSWTETGSHQASTFGLFARRQTLWQRHSRPYRQRLLSINPHLWLALRDPTKKGMVWFFVIAMVAIWVWIYQSEGRFALSQEVLIPAFAVVHWFLLIWLIVEASGRFLESRQNGTFELILTTPSGPREIITGQAQGLKQMFLGPVLLVVVLYLAGLYHSREVSLAAGSHTILWTVALWTVAWVGLAASLTAKGLTRAIVKTFLIGFAFPLIVTIVLSLFVDMAFFTRGSAVQRDLIPYGKLAIRIALSLVVVFFYARRVLYGHFRSLIAPGEHQAKWA